MKVGGLCRFPMWDFVQVVVVVTRRGTWAFGEEAGSGALMLRWVSSVALGKRADLLAPSVGECRTFGKAMKEKSQGASIWLLPYGFERRWDLGSLAYHRGPHELGFGKVGAGGQVERKLDLLCSTSGLVGYCHTTNKASCFKPPCAIMAIAAQQDQLGPGLVSRAPSLISTLPLPFGKGGLKNLEVAGKG
ncbi:unnamed protein product [Prunus armeniaca]